jgi:starch synthase (maltosyl-transferring)
MREGQTFPPDGRRRVAIENVTPQIGSGRHPIKRTIGERVVVEANMFADGHDLLSGVVKYRKETTPQWSECEMEPLANDRWRGEFVVVELGNYFYTVDAWIDRFKSWRDDVQKKIRAGQDVALDLREGAALVEESAQRAGSAESEQLKGWARELAHGESASAALLMDKTLVEMAGRYSDRRFATTLDQNLRVVVDPERARFSAWYEMFPRSFPTEPGRHGTFKDCEAQLPRIAEMGFDVLYFPPIHPIGQSFRKGKNNNPTSQEGEPGSPWGIGAKEGGHKAIHPQLGTLDDFRQLVQKARQQGIEIALDIAFQCSPDHPYVKEHPEWFRKRADGSIHYAENPPKKYQDIYPFDFECEDWRGLWAELKSVFDFWIEQGVTIFRVDNPHTKAFPFWEWCIGGLKQQHPELIFLAEAFARPSLLYHLAKIGFTQSYNYFPWRNTKEELTDYLTQLTRSEVAEYFRPVLWPNTPDILPLFLQIGGRVAFEIRLILAATLGASYGIYGPAFELGENIPLQPGAEEYLNAEKFEIRRWDLNAPQSLSGLITRVNRIRRENPALRSNHLLKFHPINNDYLLAFTKSIEDGSDIILTVVNLDPNHVQSGWLDLPVADFLIDAKKTYQMHDLLTGARFLWTGARNYVELDPQYSPAHIFRLRQHVRTEQEFDYFM